MADIDRKVGDGYAVAQLQRAVAATLESGDEAARKRARGKADSWRNVLEGMADGSLRIGSRAPVAGAPAWATPVVAHGGFATGELAAGGSLDESERERLASSQVGMGNGRAPLNQFALEGGFGALQESLASGKYAVDVAEEGALMVLAWLLKRGHAEQAVALLEEISPHFEALRFYPKLRDVPELPGAMVHRFTVGQVRESLKKVKTPAQLLTMIETLTVWQPLYDEVVELFAETVEGELPRLTRQGEVEKTEGGWPCRVRPQTWNERARSWQERDRRASLSCKRSRRFRHPKSNYSRLRVAMASYLDGTIGARDVGWVRRVLAATTRRHGVPGTSERKVARARQQNAVQAPLYADIARILANRLAELDVDGGLPSLERYVGPVSEHEAGAKVPTGTKVPVHLSGKVEMGLLAPLEHLIEQGVVPSAEVLAAVLPQLTAQVAAAGIRDPELATLYAKIYQAHRRRRGLLLLNLESQVGIDELPWVKAIEPFRETNLGVAEIARQTLIQVSTMAIAAYPHTILPNPLVTELQSLARQAQLDIPLVEEIAADIFVGTFSSKYLRAAQTAARVLDGTLYACYYELPVKDLLNMHAEKKRWRVRTSQGFDELCQSRVPSDKGGNWVARNGAVLEQEQILTTHNLAVLFDALPLKETLGERLTLLATDCLNFVFARLAMKVDNWRAQLWSVKNAAYAWRQMVFYLSLISDGEQAAWLSDAAALLREQPASVQRLEPALRGLSDVARGCPSREVQPFLGWALGRHWLLEPS